ncbi:hypothetical protein RZS08_48890, partial [Arthrospira platensis SPKY1]|nr:hypothetical protein [Arthrospira platensis SPKY1]
MAADVQFDLGIGHGLFLQSGFDEGDGFKGHVGMHASASRGHGADLFDHVHAADDLAEDGIPLPILGGGLVE